MSFSLKELLSELRKDPENAITEEQIQEMLKENQENADNYHYLDDKTASTIKKDVHDCIYGMDCINQEQKESLVQKLQGWRYMEDLRDYKPQQIVRMVKKDTGKLSLPMVGLDVKFTRLGTNIKCKYIRSPAKYLEYGIDRYYVFQKITTQEYFVLLAKEYTETTDEINDPISQTVD